jgi:hypothetical protein
VFCAGIHGKPENIVTVPLAQRQLLMSVNVSDFNSDAEKNQTESRAGQLGGAGDLASAASTGS